MDKTWQFAPLPRVTVKHFSASPVRMYTLRKELPAMLHMHLSCSSRSHEADRLVFYAARRGERAEEEKGGEDPVRCE